MLEFFRLFWALLVSLLLPVDGWSQQKYALQISSEGVTSRYLQQLTLDVADVAGHQVRIQESERIFPADRAPVIAGERVTGWKSQGFSNYIGGVGPAWGYVTMVTEKGNRIILEYTGNAESVVTASGSRRGTYNGTARFVGGTGKFARIRGFLVDTTRFDTDAKNGYNVGDSRGEYWFDE